MDEGKVIIEAKDSGGVRIALRPAEDGSIWMNIREIADIFNVGGASVERQIKKHIKVFNHKHYILFQYFMQIYHLDIRRETSFIILLASFTTKE